MGRSIGLPADDEFVGQERPAASVVSLFATTHRWWKLAFDNHGISSAPVALAGIASSVVWRGSIVSVPCASPEDADAGPCACSLHAPATAMGRARSLASVVVGGYVRVLSVDHEVPERPQALVAVEGPLMVFAWCAGAQDGLSLERCDDRPHWVVHAAGSGSAFCRRHLRTISRRLRQERIGLRDFESRAIEGLRRRYGVEVGTGTAAPPAGPPGPAGSRRPVSAVPSRWPRRGTEVRSS